jgi:hypothetical protein
VEESHVALVAVAVISFCFLELFPRQPQEQRDKQLWFLSRVTSLKMTVPLLLLLSYCALSSAGYSVSAIGRKLEVCWILLLQLL